MAGIIAAIAVVHLAILLFDAEGKRKTDLNFEEADLERRSL